MNGLRVRRGGTPGGHLDGDRRHDPRSLLDDLERRFRCAPGRLLRADPSDSDQAVARETCLHAGRCGGGDAGARAAVSKKLLAASRDRDLVRRASS